LWLPRLQPCHFLCWQGSHPLGSGLRWFVPPLRRLTPLPFCLAALRFGHFVFTPLPLLLGAARGVLCALRPCLPLELLELQLRDWSQTTIGKRAEEGEHILDLR
jgi:hypothetical protein